VTGFFLNEKNQRRYQTTVGGRLSNVNAEKIFNLKPGVGSLPLSAARRRRRLQKTQSIFTEFLCIAAVFLQRFSAPGDKLGTLISL